MFAIPEIATGHSRGLRNDIAQNNLSLRGVERCGSLGDYHSAKALLNNKNQNLRESVIASMAEAMRGNLDSKICQKNTASVLYFFSSMI